MAEAIVKEDWGDKHTRCVEMYYLLGSPPAAIAMATGFPKKRVLQIVKDPRAKELAESARKKIIEKTSADIAERVGTKLNLLRDKAVDALDETLTAAISPLHKAKPNQDRVALKLLEGTGDLKKDEPDRGQGVVMTPEMFDKLVTAMQKSDRVQNRQATAEAIEADFEIED